MTEHERRNRAGRATSPPSSQHSRAGAGATAASLPARPSSELPQPAPVEPLSLQRRESNDTPNEFERDPFGLAPVQMDGQRDAPAADVTLATAARGVSGGGTQLPFMDAIQASFGHHDVSGIEAHVGGDAARASAAIGAEAYATGNHVAFKSAPDLHTAAHEAAHIVQQRGGLQLKGGVGEAGDAYEQHADAVADRVVRGESAAPVLDQMAGGTAGTPAVQRKAAKDPLSELRALDTIIGTHVDVIVGTLAQATTPETAGRDIAPNVRSVARLLWQAAEIARERSPEMSRAIQATIDSLQSRIDVLFRASRRASVHMVQAGLEEVFAAEDAMLIASGEKAARHRAGFYGDRTASDLAGVPRAPGVDPGDTGSELIAKIQSWFSYEPLRVALGLTDLLPILQEPPRTREPSTFESLLATIANHVVGLLPGYLSGLLGSVITDGANSVLKQADDAGGSRRGGGSGFPMNTDPTYTHRPSAGGKDGGGLAPSADSKDGGGLARFVAKHPEVRRAVAAFAQVSPLAGKHVVSPVVDKLSGGIVEEVGRSTEGGTGKTSRATQVRDDKRPLSTAFVAHVTDGLQSYVNATTEKVSQLGRALELYPPASLAAIYDGLTMGAQAVGAKLRVDLIAEWASFVAAASLSEDKEGHLGGHGTLQNIVEMPGVVQIAMNVTRGPGFAMRPRVEVQSITMNGMSESAVFELRRSARPLETVALHRVVRMTLEDGHTGINFPAGRFALSPENRVNLDDASWAALAQIAAGSVPDDHPSRTQERIARQAADRGQVEGTAVFLLALANKTTADIQ